MIDFRRLDGPGDFWFLRHGESEGNNARLLQGRADYPLSEAGRQQARRVAGWFADKGIRAVLCSPLARAAETARILTAALGLPDPESRAGATRRPGARFSARAGKGCRGPSGRRALRPVPGACGRSWPGVGDPGRCCV
jgi:hypothetical protein